MISLDKMMMMTEGQLALERDTEETTMGAISWACSVHLSRLRALPPFHTYDLERQNVASNIASTLH